MFRGARRVGDRYFTVLLLENDTDGARLGMAVSRRTAPRAVDRNRIKRLVRESFRHWRTQLGNCDVVVIAKVPCREAGRPAIHLSLTGLWQRASKRCRRS
ncbi:MAG TPA: ribonuclease P protein component [Gammaproteobacteria bacterium]|nr:ribonuclease P protein component [Gammaproteobacteria bacterium]